MEQGICNNFPFTSTQLARAVFCGALKCNVYLMSTNLDCAESDALYARKLV